MSLPTVGAPLPRATRDRWLSPAKVLAMFAVCAVAAKLALVLRPMEGCLEPRSPAHAAAAGDALRSSSSSSSWPAGVEREANSSAGAPATAHELLVISIATLSHKEFVINWAAHMRKIAGLRHLVGTYDPRLEEFCTEAGIEVEFFSIEALTKELQDRHISSTPGGIAKVAGWQFVHRHLSEGLDVLYSDIDTVWLRDPRPYFAAHPVADVMVSTDCLSHRYETRGAGLYLPVSNWGGEIAAQKFAGIWPRCGHNDGDLSGIGLNAGVLLLRSRPPSLHFMRAWEADMLKFEAPQDGHQAEGLHDMTDQESLIKVLTKGVHPIKEDPPGSRAFPAAGGLLKLATLPVAQFSNGHVYFVQRTPQQMQVQPYVVHATFQLGGTSGKKNRMREHHLWLGDPPEYFAEGSYIGYDDVIPVELLTLAEPRSSKWRELEVHMRVVSFYLHVTHHLLGLARALNRTVILPRMLCFCDRDEHPDVLPQCTTSASDLSLPYICPMDHVFDVARWDALNVPFRPNSFLESPFLAKELRDSVLRLRVNVGRLTGSNIEQRWHAGFVPVEGEDGLTGMSRLPGRQLQHPGMTLSLPSMDTKAVAKIKAASRSHRVLLLSGIPLDVPYCAGKADPLGADFLTDLQRQLVWDTSWCCSDFDKGKGTHPFRKPEGYAPLQSC